MPFVRRMKFLSLRNRAEYIYEPISTSFDSQYGPSIELFCIEHVKYIDELLIKYFDVTYSFYTQTNVGNYIIHFENLISLEQLNKCITRINEIHSLKRQYVEPIYYSFYAY